MIWKFFITNKQRKNPEPCRILYEKEEEKLCKNIKMFGNFFNWLFQNDDANDVTLVVPYIPVVVILNCGKYIGFYIKNYYILIGKNCEL